MTKCLQYVLISLTIVLIIVNKLSIYQCSLTGDYCLTQGCCEVVAEDVCSESECCDIERKNVSFNTERESSDCCYLVTSSQSLGEVLKNPNQTEETLLVFICDKVEIANITSSEANLKSTCNDIGSPPSTLPLYQLYCSYLC